MPGSKPTAPIGPPAGDMPQAPMRREHSGKWLAWSEDEGRILAVGDSPEEIRAAAERAGHSRFLYDWVPPVEIL